MPDSRDLRNLHGDPDRPYPGKTARQRFGDDQRERSGRYQYDTRRHDVGFTERTRLWDYLRQHGISCVRLDEHDQFAAWPFRWIGFDGQVTYFASKARGAHVLNPKGGPKWTSYFVPEKKIEIAKQSPHRHVLIWHSDDLLECVWTDSIREDWQSYGFGALNDRVREWQKATNPSSRTYFVPDRMVNIGWDTLFAHLRGEWERPALAPAPKKPSGPPPARQEKLL